MKIDLTKGIDVEIGGEIGKHNTLPIETLVKIAENLQNLIISIAKYDLSESEAIDLNNFKIELSGFFKASAVPRFSYTQRVQFTTGDIFNQRERVSNRLDGLITIASQGNYTDLAQEYPDSFKRNVFVNSLYDFTNSCGNSPISIGNYKEDKFEKVYSIKKFKSKVKDSLITNIQELSSVAEPEEYYEKVKVTKTGRRKNKKVLYELKEEDASLSYSHSQIISGDKRYILATPLRSLFKKEEDFFIIQNELIDIIGTGQTVKEAEESFAQEFDYIYETYLNTPSERLSRRLQDIKQILQIVIKEIQ